jgi:hypothetical protein
MILSNSPLSFELAITEEEIAAQSRLLRASLTSLSSTYPFALHAVALAFRKGILR